MVPTPSEMSKIVAKDFSNAEVKAKNLISLLICGSHKTADDIGIIERFRDRQIVNGITGAFLMKDIEFIDDKGNKMNIPEHEKIHHIWGIMNKGDNLPLIIVYAGPSSSISLGLNAEIQEISKDKEKIDCSYLYKTPDASLVSHEQCFANVREVKDEQQFIEEAEKVIKAYVRQAKMFYEAQNKVK